MIDVTIRDTIRIHCDGDVLQVPARLIVQFVKTAQQIAREKEMGVPPHWILGEASCGSGDAPKCSLCGMAVSRDQMEKHQVWCWIPKVDNGA